MRPSDRETRPETRPEPDTRSFPMPDGLPASLNGGVEGFNALCALLGIVGRRDKRQLVNDSRVRKHLKARARQHAPGTKSAVRMRRDLACFFGLADVRLDIWIDLYDASDGFARPLRDPFPCLEYVALRNYGTDLRSDRPTDAELSGFADYFQAQGPLFDWEAPALAALPAVHADLEGWDSLGKDRRQDAMLAAFAVASLLNDTRLLRWATERNEELATEFAFVTEHPGTVLPERGPEFDVRFFVTVACGQLINAAADLSDDPFDETLFERVKVLSGELESLRAPTLEIGRLKVASEDLAALFAYYEERAEGEPGMLGRLPGIKDAWKSARVRGIDALREAVHEVRSEVANLFDEWSKARQSVEETAQLLSDAEERAAAAPDDMAGELELEVAKYRYENLLAAQTKRDAEGRIVAAMQATKPPRKSSRRRNVRTRDAGRTASAEAGTPVESGLSAGLKKVIARMPFAR